MFTTGFFDIGRNVVCPTAPNAAQVNKIRAANPAVFIKPVFVKVRTYFHASAIVGPFRYPGLLPLETEVKIRIANLDLIQQRLRGLGFRRYRVIA